MEKLPILYNVVFRCDGNVGYIFLIDVMFCKVHRIGPRNMCVDFERNRLRIEDFRKSEKIVCFLWRDVARKRDVVRQSEGRLQKRHSVRNVFQPTRSFYDFRFKSYGPLCDFYKSGDLDLDLYPIFTQKNCQGPWNWVHELSKFQKDWTSGVACTSRNYGQTNRQTQTDRWKGTQRVHTLQNWTYRLSDLPCRLTVTKVGTQSIVLMTQMKSVQWVEYYLGSILLQYRKYVTLTFYIWPWPFSLTFDLDIWPWDWSIITLMFWRKHYKNVLFWRHVTQKRHLIC